MRVPLTTDPAWEFDPTWSRNGTQLPVQLESAAMVASISFPACPSDGSGQDRRFPWSQRSTPQRRQSWCPGDRSIVYGDDGDNWIHTLDDRSPPPFCPLENARAGTSRHPLSRRPLAGLHVGQVGALGDLRQGPFLLAIAEHKVSVDGGMAARWRGDGKELFFLSLDATLMAAGVETAGGFRALVPESLFPSGLSLTTLRPYAVASDGQRFLDTNCH